jgi:hypothetical protein
MAATEKKQMWFWASDSGVAPVVREYPIAASQGIFMPGASCYICNDGTVKLAATTAAANQVFHGFIVGMANASATWPVTAELSANTKVKVALVSTDQIWAAYAENNGTDSVVAQTQIGDQLGLTVSSTAGHIGYTTVDVNKATNVVVQVVDMAPNVEPEKFTTTAPGVLLVRFLQANIQVTAS